MGNIPATVVRLCKTSANSVVKCQTMWRKIYIHKKKKNCVHVIVVAHLHLRLQDGGRGSQLKVVETKTLHANEAAKEERGVATLK